MEQSHTLYSGLRRFAVSVFVCFGRMFFGKPVKGNMHVTRTALVLEASSMRCGWSTDRPTDRPTSKHVSMPSNIRYVNLCKKWMRISPKYEILKIHAQLNELVALKTFSAIFGLCGTYSHRMPNHCSKCVSCMHCVWLSRHRIHPNRTYATPTKDQSPKNKKQVKKKFRLSFVVVICLFVFFFREVELDTVQKPIELYSFRIQI